MFRLTCRPGCFFLLSALPCVEETGEAEPASNSKRET